MIWFLPLALAAAGALADKKQPLRGAALGAAAGLTGGAALGAAGAGAGAAGAAGAGAGAAGTGAGLLGSGAAAGTTGATVAGTTGATTAGTTGLLGTETAAATTGGSGLLGGTQGALGAETATQAAAPVTDLSSSAGLFDKMNYQTSGLLGKTTDAASQYGKYAKPIMSAVEATRPPEQPQMQAPVMAPPPSTGPQGLNQIVQSNNDMAAQNQQQMMQRRMAQRARLQRMMG